MPNYNRNFTEEQRLMDRISPVSSSTQVNGAIGWVPVQGARGYAIFQTGLIAATGTCTVQIRQAQNASGTGAKPFKAATTLDDTGDNLVIIIEWRAEELDVANGFNHLRLEIIPATAASVVSATLWESNLKFSPVITSTIAQIVV